MMKLFRRKTFSSDGASTKNSIAQSVTFEPPPVAQRPGAASVQPGKAGKV